VGATDLYENSWDHAVVFVGQFVGLVMLCIGFMQIFIDQDHRKQIAAQQHLAREQERTELALTHSENLRVLLLEREEIIRQLALSNKSAGMGALVASFAHELNQPLTATLLHAELMQAKMASAQREREPLDLVMLSTVADAIVNDTQRAGDIIRKLRNLFRMSKGEYTDVPLASMVREMLDLVRSKIHHNQILIHAELNEVLQLWCDATQLQQVVLNLINNAIEAMMEMPERQAHLCVRGKVSGLFIDIEVEDNGKGIAPEQRDDMFSLFKTSKSQGMGVGLWLSRAIVEAHGGRLTCHSEPGVRTVFTLRLPLKQGSPSF
jgi:signal transduction histidine kinase